MDAQDIFPSCFRVFVSSCIILSPREQLIIQDEYQAINFRALMGLLLMIYHAIGCIFFHRDRGKMLLNAGKLAVLGVFSFISNLNFS
jgi:hypothetical protein